MSWIGATVVSIIAGTARIRAGRIVYINISYVNMPVPVSSLACVMQFIMGRIFCMDERMRMAAQNGSESGVFKENSLSNPNGKGKLRFGDFDTKRFFRVHLSVYGV
jgi:hypothetical protein